MEELEVRNLILLRLYEAWLIHDTIASLHSICQETGWPETPFASITERMECDGLICDRAFGYGRITPTGILLCEDKGLLPANVITSNRTLRETVLELLAEKYEAEGSLAGVHLDTLSRQIEVEPENLDKNILLLSRLEYIDTLDRDTYKITDKGREVVKNRRDEAALRTRFEEIQSMKPHARGKALEALAGTLAIRSGWNVIGNVRTPSEEIDLVLHRGREYFLVECKWKGRPVEAKIIREFYGKLANRVDIRGLFISMSGFTRGAVIETERYASSRIILLFGGRDMTSLFRREMAFQQLLDEKYEAMVATRIASFH